MLVSEAELMHSAKHMLLELANSSRSGSDTRKYLSLDLVDEQLLLVLLKDFLVKATA